MAGTLATGVTIVTTGSKGEEHGCTASAVTSLSLAPPLMLVCLDRLAKTHVKMIEAGKFAINILAAGCEGERLSRLFAGKAEDKFRGIASRRNLTGAPILCNASAWLECELERTYEGGDHTIFIGRVVAADLT
ncbi:MAG: flavin reductase, partial [bacterium]|nr:flavin reductase [bacterium]